MVNAPPIVPEFSRVVAVERLSEGAVAETITAGETECRALAKRFGLVAIESLSASLELRRIGGGQTIRVQGRFAAKVVETCVVSLEPMKSRIEEDFSLLYAPQAEVGPQEHVIEIDETTAADDIIEPVVDGQIDIGEAVAQQLALALNPYPRKPGVTLDDVIGPQGEGETGDAAHRPFAALARLAKKGG